MWEHRPPRDVAVGILNALFAPERAVSEAAPSVFRLTRHQTEGARRVRATMERWGGAILADAVGLGKTHIALDISVERVRTGHDLVVVVPASLRHHWKPLLAKVRGPWRLVSHAQLSRGVALRPARGPRLVVVDEAHRFRNPRTVRYGALARLVSGAPSGRAANVLLLTATPVNNSVEDLYSLVRLFLPDDGLRDVGVPSLLAAFRPGRTGAVHDPVQVRAVVRAVQVRRSRFLVEQRFGALAPPGSGVGFPRRAAPSLVRYQDPALEERVRGIEALRLDAYGPGAAPLIRLGLLKRLDSSPAAFGTSTTRLRASLRDVVKAAAAGRLLRPGLRWTDGDVDPLQLSILDVLAEPAPPDVDLATLMASTLADIEVLQELEHAAGDRAPKLVALASLLDRLAPAKVVVFTEYRDTAEELWRRLSRSFRVGRVDGGGAWLGARPAGRRAVVERFAPLASGRPAPPDRERVDVLIATDVLSEGLNLQDASHVVSYDLPWNPVRLLQRIGRVERIGSPHPEVFPHLFVPARGLDAVLGLTRKVRTKLGGIAEAVGEPGAEQLLETLTTATGTAVARALKEIEREGREPWEGLRTLWLSARDSPGPAWSAAGRRAGATGRATCGDTGPPWLGVLRPGSRARAGTADDTRALVLARRGRAVRLLTLDTTGTVCEGDRATPWLLRAALDGEVSADSGCAPAVTTLAESAAQRVIRFLRSEAAMARAPACLERSSPEARMARRVGQLLARAGSELDRQTIADAETVLCTLDAPLPPATAALVDSLLERDDLTGSPGELIGQLLDALAGHHRTEPDPTRASGGESITIQAILLVVREGDASQLASDTSRSARPDAGA